MKDEKNIIVLIPHVFPPQGFEVESDIEACRKIYELTKGAYNKRMLLADGKYSHNEIKYIIGFCDFFLGSRMHACIAALSQGIPAVGIAYSKKFYGVFESIGLGDCIVNARTCTENELLEKIGSVFEAKELIRKQLKNTMPSIQREVSHMFEDLEL